MSEKKKASEEIVLGPGAKDDKLAAKEAKVEEQNAETIIGYEEIK